MKIISKLGKQVHTLEEWGKECPPKREYQWKEGRSAMETAKAWWSGPPKEFMQLFPSGFIVEEVFPEHRSAFDKFGGETRNHDLLVIGKTLDGEKTVVCIESKVDESFGDTLTDQVRSAANTLKEKPSSNALQRAEDLRIALFGEENDNQNDLRYQLMTAVAGSITEAQKQGVNKVYFVLQTFVSQEIDPVKHEKNQRDLDAFIDYLSKGKYRIIHNGDIVGPINVPGNEFISNEIDLYICKIDIKI